MQDKTIPAQAGALRSLADLMERHGLTAAYITSSDHRHISGTFAFSAIVDSAEDLKAWAHALNADSFESYRARRAKEAICATVRGSIGGDFFDVSWWTQRIPRVIVPAEGEHRSPLCSLEPLTGWAA